jgi:hypothetical protein
VSEIFGMGMRIELIAFSNSYARNGKDGIADRLASSPAQGQCDK